MILGVTLARGGSKGIHKKNIALCAGKYLIEWTIEQALASRLIDKYIVSTDDEDIEAIATAKGAEVIKRPVSLATDEANRWDVLKDIIKKYPEAKTIVLLQATSPVRKDGRIDECIKSVGYAESLATGFYLQDIGYPQNKGENRQLMPKTFFDDGNIYIWKRELIEKYHKQEAGISFICFETSKWENVDINTVEDLSIANKILSSGVHI